jgi:hypothetical protein
MCQTLQNIRICRVRDQTDRAETDNEKAESTAQRSLLPVEGIERVQEAGLAERTSNLTAKHGDHEVSQRRHQPRLERA